MFISLSILEYEQILSENIDILPKSPIFIQILKLIETGKISFIHIDVMRPPLIPNRITFPIKLIEKLYKMLHEKISLSFHLMVPDPILIVNKINRFIPKEDRAKTLVTIQRESFNSENETLDAINFLRKHGYGQVGICLDLSTPCRSISEKTVEAVDFILLMTVHMGRGRQKYVEGGTKKIKYFSQRYPDKPIWVDGGINLYTARIAEKAGAKTLVIGSFITRNRNPTKTLLELTRSFDE
ncbi:TPA: hypothetical protein EYP75_01615 [Candidatus Bathyarchaeota archaeon]|nr:hypothetical protein [Candidatus Bathyarchaeota archaeon]